MALPYLDQFASQRRRLTMQYQQAINRMLGERNSLNTDYASKAGEVEAEKPNAYRRVLNSAAGRGMAFSSGYGQQRADTGKAFAGQLASLAAVRDSSLAGLDSSQGNLKQNYQYNLAELRKAQTAAQLDLRRRRRKHS